MTAVLLEVGSWSSDKTQSDLGSNVNCYVLSTAAVLAPATSQFDIPKGADRTLPFGSTDRTVMMDWIPEVHSTSSKQTSLVRGRDVGKTQPLVQRDMPGALLGTARENREVSAPLSGPSSRRLWIALGVALLLVGLAMVIGLLRR